MYVTVITKFLLLTVFVVAVSCNGGEYYWRPWTSGSPPHDAFTALDYRGVSYIVEAYVPNYGLYIGQVFVNQHEVNVTVSNSTTTTHFMIRSSSSLKVLCTQSLEKLAWFPTNYTTLQKDIVIGLINPVLGGMNSDNQVAYIGRHIDAVLGQIWVGTVIKDNKLYFYHKSKEQFYSLYNYEILVIGSRCAFG